VTDCIATLGLPELTAGLLVVALNAYVLTGGADFGGGVWDLLASGPRHNKQRNIITAAIGPIWEANHVWLVIAVVMCFTAFPAAFATLGTVLHIPLAVMLVGVVLRGSAFVFRSYGNESDAARQRWGVTFAIASTITPLLFGMVIGALSSGAVGVAQGRVGTASFFEVFVAPWLAPFPIAVGLLALTLFALLAATYLTIAAPDETLREDFRRRALGAAGAVFVSALGAMALSRAEAPLIRTGLLATPWSLLLQVVTGTAAVVGIWALWRRRFALARMAVASQASLILWGWAVAQYPYLVPEALTIRATAAPHVTLEVLVQVLAGGAVILIPSLLYLHRTFATRKPHRNGGA
jgi:cytochrome d ubiquinol oxidase subunit II